MNKRESQIRAELEELRTNGNPKGQQTGFKCIDEIYTIKQGAFTIILAEPHHGKSEFGFELCLNQNKKYGKKCLIYSPETGTVADIKAELIHKYTKKPVLKSMPNHLTDLEFYKALTHIDHYFKIIDSDEKSFTYQEIMKECTDEQIIFVDPNNEVKQDFTSTHGTRQDLYIEDIAGEIRRWCRNNKKHMIITMHPAIQQIVPPNPKEGTPAYYPMPKARQAAGGQAWFRKAMGWINLWRSPTFLKDENGMPYPENNMIGVVEKAKPKGIGKRGQFELYFDWKTNRYYEKVGYLPFYAFDHENNKSFLQPSQLFETEKEPF